MSKLLSPVTITNLELANRVVMSPMCMYEVKKEDGILTPFHFAHYGARALSKVGLIIIESTGVLPDGRISKNDLGLWNEAQQAELTRLVEILHSFGTKVGIQLNHAGRKAEDAIKTVAPSPLRFNQEYPEPAALSHEEIKAIQQAFVAAVKRSVAANLDMIELHGAHGYLISQFLSNLTNKRTDKYGGNLENRYRFLGETVTEIRQFYKGPLWVRLSLSDYDETGVQNSIDEWLQIGQWLEAAGVDCLDISTGGLIDKKPNIPISDGYQVPYTTVMKQNVTIPVTAVGHLDNAGLCEYILQNNQADLVLQGRALIRNVNWLADAAVQLRDTNFQVYNNSYLRGQRKSSN
ncbi:oxidoreductase [Enterococcus sp. LJL90]